MKKYCGVDVGTTGIKALVVNETGEVEASFTHPLQMQTPHPGWAQQNPQRWWEGVWDLLQKVATVGKIDAISFSGQMHSLVALDGAGEVVRDAILWCDGRTREQCVQATDALGGEARVIQKTGNPIYEGFTLPKLLWLEQNEPDSFARISHVMLPKDFIVYRLTGEWNCEPSDASATSCFNVVQGCWDEDIRQTFAFPKQWFPPLRGSSQVVGEIRKDLAAETGFQGVKVVSGGADNAVAALGIGVFEQGQGMVSIGTSGTVLCATQKRQPDVTGKIHFFHHVRPGLSYYMGVMLSAANSLNWWRNRLVSPSGKAASEQSWSALEAAISDVPPGAQGLLFLPYLNGERTPHRDPDARGVLFGLSSLHDVSHVLRAVMEGITFGLKDSYEAIQSLEQIQGLRMVGGGAKNRTWGQMVADIFGCEVEVPLVDEGGAYGAAMLAALGDGLPEQLVKNWVSLRERFSPNAQAKKRYEPLYTQYQQLYHDLKSRFGEVARLERSQRES